MFETDEIKNQYIQRHNPYSVVTEAGQRCLKSKQNE